MNTTPTNTADLRAALTEARDWFESQAKAVSKGCGSSYELHDLRVQRDALDAALDAPAQAAAPAQAGDTLHMIAIEELAQLGYTFDGAKMTPPDFVGDMLAVVRTSPCGCRSAECESKSDRVCRMTTEIVDRAAREAIDAATRNT